jgi:hypothetical protein
MNLADLSKIEKVLSITLPDYYKQTMLNYPLEGLKYVQKKLLNDPDTIIEINQKFRNDGFRKKPWVNNFFLIGFNSEKSFNFIDVHEQDESVYAIVEEDKFNPKNIAKLRLTSSFTGRFVNICKEMEEFITMGKQNKQV